jgi:anion-transporting  ArsA/GET3 family ATPase
MHKLTTKPMQVITGKGGVGKSAVAAALALALAEDGKKRVLLATLDGSDDVSRLLGCMPLDDTEREVLPGVWAVSMSGESARLEYAIKVLKFERMARIVFANRLVRNLLDFVPGLNAVNQLGKLFWHVTERGAGQFDHVVLEAPASGHALITLRSPTLIHQMSPPGPMRKETQRIVKFLADPNQTAVHVVTLTASMSCREAVQLADALRQRAQMPVGLLVCNRVPDQPPTGVIPEGDSDWSEFMTTEVERARAEHERLAAAERDSKLERIDCPEFPGAGRAVVGRLAEHFRSLR